jgi:nucleoside-diphosphate-sugar epimerase
VESLVELGPDVVVFHRGTGGCDVFPECRHLHGSHAALSVLRPQLASLCPDVVLDLICYTERHAQEVVDASRDIAGRIVASSSSDVYRNYDGLRGKATAGPDPIPLSEDAPVRESLYPYRGYDLPFEWADEYEKLSVERVILEQPTLPGTILRLPAVYGPGDKQHRILPYLRLMEAGERTIPIAREQAPWRWTRGYVQNVAAAVALAVTDDRARNRIYNVGEKAALTEREWIEAIGEAAGWSGRVEEVEPDRVPAHLRQPFDFRYELATDTSRIRAELSYVERVTLGEGLKRTVEWERLQLSAS